MVGSVVASTPAVVPKSAPRLQPRRILVRAVLVRAVLVREVLVRAVLARVVVRPGYRAGVPDQARTVQKSSCALHFKCFEVGDTAILHSIRR